eukprot:5027751-Prymnesium_polylepis.2
MRHLEPTPLKRQKSKHKRQSDTQGVGIRKKQEAAAYGSVLQCAPPSCAHGSTVLASHSHQGDFHRLAVSVAPRGHRPL